MSKIPYRNSEGYADPTAHAALEPIAQDEAALEKLYKYEDTLLEPSEVKQLIEELERSRRIIRNLAEGKLNSIEALQAECRRAASDLF